MKKSDWAVVVLNALTILTAVSALMGAMDSEGAQIALAVSVFTMMVNGGWVIRRGSQEPGRAVQGRADAGDPTLDARQLLEIDQRIEALELAQHDAADAARWRALAESGQVTAPAAAPRPAAGDARRQPVAG